MSSILSAYVAQLQHRAQSGWRSIVVFVPYIWLFVFFLAPFIIVLKISLAESLIASPPFSPLFEWTQEGVLTFQLIFDNYSYLWEDDLYVKTYLNSIKISSISTILCLILGYPIAYAIVRSSPTTKNILLRSYCASTRGWGCWPIRARSTVFWCGSASSMHPSG